MARNPALAVALALAVAGVSATASATTVYSYSGNPFTSASGVYTTSAGVTGTLTVASPLAPNLTLQDISGQILAFSFEDLTEYLENLLGSIVDYVASTDGSGNITEWQIEVQSNTPDGLHRVALFNVGGVAMDEAQLGSSFGSNTSSPGAWEVIPEPGSAALLACGLASVAAARRRRTPQARLVDDFPGTAPGKFRKVDLRTRLGSARSLDAAEEEAP